MRVVLGGVVRGEANLANVRAALRASGSWARCATGAHATVEIETDLFDPSRTHGKQIIEICFLLPCLVEFCMVVLENAKNLTRFANNERAAKCHKEEKHVFTLSSLQSLHINNSSPSDNYVSVSDAKIRERQLLPCIELLSSV